MANQELKKILERKYTLADGERRNMFSVHDKYYDCQICSLNNMNEVNFMQHLIGKKHKSSLMKISVVSNFEQRILIDGYDGTKKYSQLQNLINQLTDKSVIGLEYVIEVHQSSSFESVYHCVLCEGRFDNATIISHITGYNHRLKYLEKHFPTAFNEISNLKKTDNNEFMHGLMEKICEGIENQFGHLPLLLVENSEFSKNQMKFTEMALYSKHIDEYMGLTFIDIIHENLGKESNQEWPFSDIADDEFESHKASLDSISSTSEFITSNQQSPSVISLISSSSSHFNATNISRVSGNTFEWEEFRLQMDTAKRELKKTYKFYKKKPDKHPDYKTEWESFWKRRYKELTAAHIPTETYNYTPEWFAEWKKIMEVRLKNEIEVKKHEIKKKLEILNYELAKNGQEPKSFADWKKIMEVRFKNEIDVKKDEIKKKLKILDYEMAKNEEIKKQLSEDISDIAAGATQNIRLKKIKLEQEMVKKHDKRSKGYELTAHRRRSKSRSSSQFRSSKGSRSCSRSRSPQRSRKSPSRKSRSRKSRSRKSRSRKSRSRKSRSRKYRSRKFCCRRSSSPKNAPSPKRKERKRRVWRSREMSPSFPSNLQLFIRENSTLFKGNSLSRSAELINQSSTSSLAGELLPDYNHEANIAPVPLCISKESVYNYSMLKSTITQGHQNPGPYHSIEPFANKNPIADCYKRVTIISVLGVLTALEDILGSLGRKVIELMTTAIAMDKSKVNSSNHLLDDHGHCIMFETIKEKLKGLINANMVEPTKEVVVKKTIKHMAYLVQEANERQNKGNIVSAATTDIQKTLPLQNRPTPRDTPTRQVTPPSVNNEYDLAEIGHSISTAYKKQCQKNISMEKLEELTESYITIANKKKDSMKLLSGHETASPTPIGIINVCTEKFGECTQNQNKDPLELPFSSFLAAGAFLQSTVADPVPPEKVTYTPMATVVSNSTTISKFVPESIPSLRFTPEATLLPQTFNVLQKKPGAKSIPKGKLWKPQFRSTPLSNLNTFLSDAELKILMRKSNVLSEEDRRNYSEHLHNIEKEDPERFKRLKQEILIEKRNSFSQAPALNSLQTELKIPVVICGQKSQPPQKGIKLPQTYKQTIHPVRPYQNSFQPHQQQYYAFPYGTQPQHLHPNNYENYP